MIKADAAENSTVLEVEAPSMEIFTIVEDFIGWLAPTDTTIDTEHQAVNLTSLSSS